MSWLHSTDIKLSSYKGILNYKHSTNQNALDASYPGHFTTLSIWSGFQQSVSHFQVPKLSLSKWGQVQKLSCENQFYLHEPEK